MRSERGGEGSREEALGSVLVCDLCAGDALFIPKFWFHQVLTLGGGTLGLQADSPSYSSSSSSSSSTSSSSSLLPASSASNSPSSNSYALSLNAFASSYPVEALLWPALPRAAKAIAHDVFGWRRGNCVCHDQQHKH